VKFGGREGSLTILESSPFNSSSPPTRILTSMSVTTPILPTKRIVSKAHLDAWLSSSTHQDVVKFVEDLNESVVGVKLTDQVPESEVSEVHLQPNPVRLVERR